MVSPKLDPLSPHSSTEQRPAPSEMSTQQSLSIHFPPNALEASPICLKERITPLESVFEEKSHPPSSEACHDLALEKLKGKTSQTPHVDGMPEEKRIQNLLIEAQEKGIIISTDLGGRAVINKMISCSEEEQWECLKKINAFIPIAHLDCERSENVERLLLFLQSNKDLNSLSLGKSRPGSNQGNTLDLLALGKLI